MKTLLVLFQIVFGNKREVEYFVIQVKIRISYKLFKKFLKIPWSSAFILSRAHIDSSVTDFDIGQGEGGTLDVDVPVSPQVFPDLWPLDLRRRLAFDEAQ